MSVAGRRAALPLVSLDLSSTCLLLIFLVIVAIKNFNLHIWIIIFFLLSVSMPVGGKRAALSFVSIVPSSKCLLSFFFFCN